MRLGVDVGGTNTDAVLMDGPAVRGWYKSPTTEDISTGIITALRKVLETTGVTATQVTGVMIGTTHFANAFVERKQLERVGIIRIALPATRGLPPLTDWPDDLKELVNGHSYLVTGGYQFDGRLNSKLDEAQLRDAVYDIKRRGLNSVAVSSLFSPVNADMELRAEAMIKNEMPGASVTLSHQVGRLGLLERENATVMNASLTGISWKVVNSIRAALSGLNIAAPFYISQNDGTLMGAEAVERYPVLTVLSGPTNSMRGAGYLSGMKNAMVADIGGTTTETGMLTDGFPRESSTTVEIGGVRTNFRMPDILVLGLGGGSLVRKDKSITVGPDSVGYRIVEEALVFGGNKLTATDIAVAAGHASIGDAENVSGLDAEFVNSTINEIRHLIETGVDRMKTSPAPLPLILVGGGSVLAPDELSGVSEIIVPEHAHVANAVGASIAQIGGEVEHVYLYSQVGRDEALSKARSGAIQNAINMGADPAATEVVDLEEVPLAYIPGGAVRVRAKAAGMLMGIGDTSNCPR